ncbi:MAG: sialidase family protein, partial [Pyrinomonadaceae bacterium]
MTKLRVLGGIGLSGLVLLLSVFPILAQTRPAAAPAQPAAKPFESAIQGLRFREIGPATMGGRVNDIEVPIQDPKVIYAAMASAGILKSVNGGTTWETLFDKEAVATIGDVAVAPSNPQIVWAGSGESNNRQSSSWGNGVYKSMDAGKTWKNMGLEKTLAIARVVIHPTNPDVVWVAATGNLWGASPERGVYKTTDGGKTWAHVLKVNDDTGATELVIDHQSPSVLYAAMYQRRRTVFGFNGSGAHSALYKSVDGGDTWKMVTTGMPYNTENAPTPRPENLLETGRISIAVYRKNTDIVYVTVEHANGGVYRSTDKGETWTKMAEIAAVPRPMYFSKLQVDPNNEQRLWLAGVAMQYSEDAGRTWTGNFSRAPHADTHGFWINPNDSNHIVQGNDGGINISFDRGRTWDYSNTVPLGYFYEVGVDNSLPYKVCGGLQDNNTWCGPSMTTNPQGISNSDWYTVGGGDGFFAQPHPTDPDIVYGESQDGNLFRRNVRTGESKQIRPREELGEKNFRFQWNSPILISSHDPNTVYYAGNFVFKSTERGDNWKKVSPDLTTDVDRNTLQIMGKVPDKNTRSRHDG